MRPSTWCAPPCVREGGPGVRALGLDLGSKRIGVALSDSEGALALPFDTVVRSGDRHRDHRRIAELAAEAEAEVVVVGLPFSLDGTEGPAARRTRREVEELERALPVPIETYDERLTTVTAQRSLIGAELDGRRRREVVDKVAAAVMLQAWLDHRRQARPDGRDDQHEDQG
jgi:putative holliday junction resolvase